MEKSYIYQIWKHDNILPHIPKPRQRPENPAFNKAKGPVETGPYCLFVFMALSLHTLVVFMLGHFFAAFFLDGTHFFSPWLLRLNYQ
jgi:hypothetical protein